MKRIAIFASLSLLFLAECNHMPDHARFIPKDALVVVGVNTKQLGKKIAWNAIMGSKLLEEMQWEKTGDVITDPSQIGIELMSTSYVYMKPDKRFTEGSRITALVPLEDEGKWEAFVKKSFPEAVIKEQKGHKDAQLAEGMYAGWNSELLIIMNTLQLPAQHAEIVADSTGDTSIVEVAAPVPAVVDLSQLAGEMNNAFSTTKENSLTGNKRFSGLENEAHDITLWMNYDELMNQYMSGANMGIPLSNSLWKNSSMAAGFDFEKGKIAGDIRYYVPDAMEQVAKDLGSKDADKEMVERLPGENLDMLMAWHLAPKGVKGLLEQTGMLGFVNLALSGEGLSADYILEAFSGDMAVSFNDFTMKKELVSDTPCATSDTAGISISGDIHYTYALRINKKENFDRLLQLAVSTGFLQAGSNGSFLLNNGSMQPATVAVNSQYCVISNNEANIKAYFDGSFKKQAKPADAEVVYGHPFGIYFNAQGMMKAVDPAVAGSGRDSHMLAESKKLLRDIHFTGGGFSSSAFNYKMAINFVNPEENSLLQLIEFTMRMNKTPAEALATGKMAY